MLRGFLKTPMGDKAMFDSFQIASLTPGLLQPRVALAACRAGELGMLDFEYARDPTAIVEATRRFDSAVKAPFGIKLGCPTVELVARTVSELPYHLKTIVLTSADPQALREQVCILREKKIAALLEVTCLDDAKIGETIGVDGLVAKGHEAGGRVGGETTFILLQRLLAEVGLPIWAHGGIGLHTVGACAAAGAAGIILDSQLALTAESPLSESVRAKISSMDGSETLCLGDQLGETYRVYFRPGNSVVKELQELESRLAMDDRESREVQAEWRTAVAQRAGWQPEQNALLIGQDAAFAAPLAEHFYTVGGVLQGMREAIQSHCQAAVKLQPLSEGSPLAVSNGTRYPILQGPMTRVSDVPEFAGRVAEGGGLPFLALALMRGPEVETVLEAAQRRLGAMPWGVGILGFVPPELRQEQMEVVRRYRPPFALIAGGRPEQSRAMEQDGISTYLHVPSPGLLRMFVQQGARRFVFEGRECGGHVGPRTSFVLWNQMVDTLLASPELTLGAGEFHVVFAAGIHDALSAAMVSVIAAPLAERGVRIGVLLGTAYLFTTEAVASGAILDTFQQQAQQCRNTVLLETGPGHSTRCVDTPFAAVFANEKRRLLAARRPAEEIRLTLEELNLGRLRIASKGVTRNPGFGRDPASPKLMEVESDQQVAQGMYMIGQVAALRDTICSVEALHYDVSVEGSNKLQSMAMRSRQEPQPVALESPSDIAIIGMACHLPKAPDLSTYWENILRKVDAVGEIPKERWDWELYFDTNPKAKDKIYSKWGGFLEDIPFDPVQYGMPPASLRSIEPAQLLTLQVVRAALADAGYSTRPFARERTSVILGAGGGAADLGLGYSARSFMPVLEHLPEFRGRSKEIVERLDGHLPEWTEDSFAGILTNVSAGRVANRFDLGGSNYTVDAACASSLAATSLALKELEGRTSDMVIVGGVDTMQNPFTYLCFSKTHALSPRGRCRPFDESADGIAISEGIAIVVLKRLADAERDGDRIYAVIKASGSSSDGKDRGLTAPRPEGQVLALKRAYAKASFSPATVELVEAHGTGTVAGDGAEVQALTEVFSKAEAPRQGCAIGSVKSMIGHTKCTAGAAGLIKAALALHHRVLPPTLGVEKPNPRAHFHDTPFFVNTEARPWLESSNEHPRRAGVSAFGFGGTNFHLVLEEYAADPYLSRPAPRLQWSDEIFLWNAESRRSLIDNLGIWEKALVGDAKPALRDLAHTAWKQAEKAPAPGAGSQVRLSIVASSLDDLKQKLSLAQQSLANAETVAIKDPRGIYFSEHSLASQGKVAFLFPGQGSQYPRMLQDLLLHFPEMQQVLEEATQALSGKLDEPLTAYVFPPASFSREEEQAQQLKLTQTNIAQPALGAVSLALFGLLEQLGLHPEMVGGHSYGEYVALAAAGVFNLETLIALSEARGRFIVEGAVAEPGVMAAIEADASAVAEVVAKYEGVCLANANAPRQTVVSGSRVGIQQVVEHFAAQGTTARMIPVACAFHSPLVAPAQARLAEFLSTADVAKPEITVFSNTTAAPYPTEPQALRKRLVEHLVRPVEFVKEIESMYDAGARIFVEVGPRGVLTNLVDEILADRPRLTVASNQSGKPGLPQLLHLLGQLAVQGCPVKLDRLYQQRANRLLDLAALQHPGPEKPLSPSVWMVNGARAIPLKEVTTESFRKQVANLGAATGQSVRAESPALVPARAPVMAAPMMPAPAPAVSSAVPRSNGAPINMSSPLPPRTTSAPAAQSAPAAPITTPASVSDGVPQLMQQFQQTMTSFLETQKTVMLAYLGAEPDATAPALSPTTSASAEAVPRNGAVNQPAPVYQPAAVYQAPIAQPNGIPEPSYTVATPSIAVAPAIETVSQPAGPSKEQLTAQLLTIVSERTGYPPEMLELNLDLEADLGIDSIKRVEILGTLQQSFASIGIAFDEGLMEKLTGVRTLHGIVERIFEQAGARPPEVSAAPAPSETKPLSIVVTGPDKAQITAQLVAIVSERTGYPPEMLDLNLDLEADLGIDSIKRVEILGTLQQTFASSGIAFDEGLMERLTGVRTLAGIIERLFDNSGAAPESKQNTPVEPTPDIQASENEPFQNKARDDEHILRFRVTSVEAPPIGRPKAIAKDRAILIAGGDHAAALELVGQLLGRGYSVAMVHHGPRVQELGTGNYTADLGSPESISELLALVNKRHGPLGGVVHLLPLEGQANLAAHDFPGWKEQLRLGVKSLFHIAQSAGKQLREAGSGATLIAATGMGGAFLSDLPAHIEPNFPDHGAVAGLMKTLAVEWPEVRVKVVDLNLEESSEKLARHLLEEMHAADGHVEVGYDGRRRLILKPTEAPLPVQAPSVSVLDPSSVVLITGGARGITARAAKRLAELYRPTLLLAGRSPLPPPSEAAETAGITTSKELKAALMEQMRARGEAVTPALVERAYARLAAEREIRTNINALKQLGAKVHYYPLDVRDQEAFGAFIEGLYSSFGRIDAVIHGAGVIEDKLIQDKMPESFDRVFDTKVDSAFVLSRKLRPESLKFLVFFSSVSGRFGNRGQGDYAAANEVLNKLAVCLDHGWPGRVTAINWGPWDTEGMVSAEVRKQFAERGVKLISSAIGLRRLEEEMNFGGRGEAEVIIGGSAWQSGQPQDTSHGHWPLLGTAGAFRSDGARELVLELDPTFDLYLNDHCLDGKPVLPLAIATELIAQTVAQGWPGMQVAAIRDLRLLHGVVVDRGTKTLRIVAKPQAGAAANPARLAVEITGAGQPHRMHYKANVELVRELPAAPALNVTALTDSHAFSMDLADFYRQWLFHGPLFQGILQVDQVATSGVKALLETSLPGGWIAGAPAGKWLIDPLMFDSALQLVVLWAREHWDATALPNGFQSYRRFATASAGRILCDVRLRPTTGRQTIHADMYFVDAATGLIVGILENMEGACSKALNRLADRNALVAVANQI